MLFTKLSLKKLSMSGVDPGSGETYLLLIGFHQQIINYFCRIEEARVVKDIQHEIPWVLVSTDSNMSSSLINSSKPAPNVQVVDGLNADRIDMSTIRNEFTPAAFSLSGWLGGWVSSTVSSCL